MKYEIQVQGQTIHVVPAALALSASFTVYKLVKLLTFPKQMPGAYYPPLAPSSEVDGGAVMTALFGHLAEELTCEEHGKCAECYWKWIPTMKTPPMVMYMGLGDIKLHPTHPDDVEHVLVKHVGNYPKLPAYGVFCRALGDGLFSQLDESVYPIHRAECAKAFAPKSLKLIADDCVNAQVGRLLDTLGEAADGKQMVEMNKVLLRVGMRITTQAAFRLDDEESLEKMWVLFHDLLENLWHPLRFLPIGDKVLLYHKNRKIEKTRRELNKMAQSVLDRLKDLPPPEEGQGKSLIDYLAHTTKMDQQTVLDNVLTFLFAGSDTTANSMFMILYYLAKHPHEQEKLLEEVSSALSLGQHPLLDDVKGCRFLRNVCKEGLRLRTPAGGVAKISLEDDVWPHSKLFVPKGTAIDCPLMCFSRFPELFGDDANKFRPDRWDDPDLEGRLGTAGFIPFSIGKRNCPGKDFALNETHLIIATVIRNFKVSWVEGEKEPFLIAAPVIQAKYPVNMKVDRRSA